MRVAVIVRVTRQVIRQQVKTVKTTRMKRLTGGERDRQK